MKKILIIICIVFGSCTTNTIQEEQVANCPVEELGLTVANKNPYLFETNMNFGGYSDDSRKFYGTISGDTLRLKVIRGFGPESVMATFYNLKIPKIGCSSAISTKQISSTYDNSAIVHTTTFDTTFDDFRVQEYISGNLLVCKTKSHYVRQDGLVVYDNRDMWIDLTTLTAN